MIPKSAFGLTLVANNMVVHCSDGVSALCTQDVWIYRYTFQTGTLERLGRIPPKYPGFMGRARDYIARNPIFQYFRPNSGIGHVQALANGSILIIYDRIYLMSRTEDEVEVSIIDQTSLGPYENSLRGGLAIHARSNKVYFGEYLNGHSRDIRVFCIDTLEKRAECCWTFSRSEIKHVHAIHYDPYRNRLWVLSGDTDEESAFYYSDDEFRTLHRFAGGSQQWRAIAVLFDKDSMEWGMDAGQDAPADAVNRIFRYTFSSGALEELAVIGNPAYAMVQTTDSGALMATSFEPKRLQDTFEGAQLWHRSPSGQWRLLASFSYELHRRRGSGSYGMALLPKGVIPKNETLLTLVNCKNHAYSTSSLTIN